MINIALTKRLIVLGLTNIWRHRLRSTLTILGIVFGVCSVIAMLAIGEGASYEAQEQIKRLGSQNIIINSVKPPESEKVSKEIQFLSEYGLTYKDAERIMTTIPDVEVIVPSRTIRSDITYKRKRIDGNLIGTIPWYPLISNKRIIKGRFFTGNEVEGVRNVCVISDDLSSRLFTYEDPLGEVIRIRGNYYTVIGIIEESAPVTKKIAEVASSLNIYIPLTTAKSYIGEIIASESTGSFNLERVELHQFIVKVKHADAVLSTAAIIRTILERFHKQLDYEVIVPLELLRQAERTKRIFNIVLGSIAAISLLVGGIGIMNIMLASVTERTREIGIRRALGARRRDIIIQFLIETVLLAGCGGVIGVILGIMIPFLITYFAEMKTIIRLWAPFLSFGISICVGIVFGIYPAYRASRMNPIIALRHE